MNTGEFLLLSLIICLTSVRNLIMSHIHGVTKLVSVCTVCHFNGLKMKTTESQRALWLCGPGQSIFGLDGFSRSHHWIYWWQTSPLCNSCAYFCLNTIFLHPILACTSWTSFLIRMSFLGTRPHLPQHMAPALKLSLGFRFQTHQSTGCLALMRNNSGAPWSLQTAWGICAPASPHY